MTNSLYGKIQSKSLKLETKIIEKKLIGVNFPFSGNRGYFSAQTGNKLLRNNLLQLMKTERGERVMLPNFGTDLKKYLFQPLDEETFDAIKVEILTSIASYLPNIEVLKLKVTSLDEIKASGIPGLNVELVCQIKDDNQLVEVGLEIV